MKEDFQRVNESNERGKNWLGIGGLGVGKLSENKAFLIVKQPPVFQSK